MPLVAAVAGYALGGGFELALACDIVIAADTASFGLPETMLGLVPGAGGTQRLVRAVGKTRAMEIILAGRRLSGEEAAAMGVASRVVGLEALEPEAMRVAGEVAARSTVGAEAREGERQPRVRHAARSGLGARAQVTGGTRLLDVGCGSGLTLVLAAQRGAVPSGLDISPGLIGIARERLPEADLREGDMEELPFAEAAFDAVIGVNAFQFAGDPGRALREAARVLRPGGRLVASLFAAPERSEGTVVHEAMAELIPPDRDADHAPYALSAPGNLEAALEDAGLRLAGDGEVVCEWRYASRADAVRGVLCSAGGARAKEAAEEEATRAVLEAALGRFEDAATGEVTMVNTFRWVAACR